MKKFTRDVLEKAREDYLKYSVTAPAQFNIKYSNEDRWEAEFHEDETCWSESFTTWMSGTAVLDLFFSLDIDLIDLSGWNEEWNCK
jgi:hypothetical protein